MTEGEREGVVVEEGHREREGEWEREGDTEGVVLLLGEPPSPPREALTLCVVEVETLEVREVEKLPVGEREIVGECVGVTEME